MLIVLMIIAVIAGVSFPALTSGLSGIRLSSASGSAASFLTSAMNRVERREQAAAIVISPKENLLAVYTAASGEKPERTLDMPKGITIEGDEPRRFLLMPGGTVSAHDARPAKRQRRAPFGPDRPGDGRSESAASRKHVTNDAQPAGIHAARSAGRDGHHGHRRGGADRGPVAVGEECFAPDRLRSRRHAGAHENERPAARCESSFRRGTSKGRSPAINRAEFRAAGARRCRPFDVPPNAGPGTVILQRIALEVWWKPLNGTRRTIQLEGYRQARIPIPAAR